MQNEYAQKPTEKSRTTNRRRAIWLMVIHVFVITSLIVGVTYELYLDRAVGMYFRVSLLEEIHQELERLKQETGEWPQSLDSHLRAEYGQLYFDSRPMGGKLPLIYGPDDKPVHDVNEIIRYELVDGEPVLTDLGRDAAPGGLGISWDIVYPPRHTRALLLADYLRTPQFRRALIYGLLLSVGTSICILGMWRVKHETPAMSLGLGSLSLLFILFECFLAMFIIAAHVYPTH